MQRRELNHATVELASSMDISGRAPAAEKNRHSRTGKNRSFWRIASLIFLGSLTAASFFIAVAPLPARADEDSRHGHEDNIHEEIAALQAQVAALQHQVNTLQTANSDQQKEINSLQTSNAKLQNQVNSLQTSNTALQKELAAVQSNHALALGPFVSVDPNPEVGVRGPNIIFSGANIHIVSGSGATNDNGNPTGLGNLIIGYDEKPPNTAGFPPFSPGDRGGSHNLVIGSGHRFTQAAFGGLVAGEANTLSNEGTSVSGGFNNTASGLLASVTGGNDNIASGEDASVSGGHSNTASGFFATVSGGQVNTASGAATVSGGSGNTAGGIGTVVIGGQNVTDNNNNSIAPQPPFP
jgi:hypothetical protein